jgi:hypothetical protein
MEKPIIVITHERSGTHLLINLINYHKNGEFNTIGFIPKNTIPYTLENYKHQVYKDIVVNSYNPDAVCKSHHQVEFMEPYIDFIFSKYTVIYLKRDIKDMLVSYYKFIPFPKDLGKFPKFEDWIFMKPDEVGRKFLLPYSPDPHVIIEPKNYIDRWLLHINGWLKYKDNILVLNYEDILTNFKDQKLIIEDYIGRKIADVIPDVNDKNLPNFNPGKGIVGEHKNWMPQSLIDQITIYK